MCCEWSGFGKFLRIWSLLLFDFQENALAKNKSPVRNVFNLLKKKIVLQETRHLQLVNNHAEKRYHRQTDAIFSLQILVLPPCEQFCNSAVKRLCFSLSKEGEQSRAGERPVTAGVLLPAKLRGRQVRAPNSQRCSKWPPAVTFFFVNNEDEVNGEWGAVVKFFRGREVNCVFGWRGTRFSPDVVREVFFSGELLFAKVTLVRSFPGVQSAFRSARESGGKFGLVGYEKENSTQLAICPFFGVFHTKN